MLRSRRGGHEARRIELAVQLDKERAEPSEDWQVSGSAGRMTT